MDDNLRGRSAPPVQMALLAGPSFGERYRFSPGHEGALWCYDASVDRRSQPSHSEFELDLVLKGTGLYLVHDRTVEVSRRSAIWLFPGQDNVLLDQSSDFRKWTVLFTPSLLRRAVNSQGADYTLRMRNPDEEHSRVIAPDMARLLAQNCEMLLGNANKHMLNAGIAYILRVAWLAYNSAPGRRRRPPVDSYLTRVVRLLQDDPTCSGTELARSVGLSRSHLSRRFCDQMGVGLVRFRNQLRIESFLNLIENDGLTMSLAALDAGFGSYAQFHRVFRELMGVSPRDYIAHRGYTRLLDH